MWDLLESLTHLSSVCNRGDGHVAQVTVDVTSALT